MSAVRESPLEGDIAPTLEQRLEAAEKTIMALCAEVSKLRQRIACIYSASYADVNFS